MLVHWLLAAHPQERPTSAKLIEVFEGLSECKVEDLEASMPATVREKIKREQKMYGARKCAEIPEECMLPSERAARAGAQRARAPPTQAATRDADLGGGGGFDLNSALAPASASTASRSEAVTQKASRSDARAVASPQNVAPPAQDLLSFGEPVQSSARSPNVGFDDLLGFDAAPAAPAAPATTSGSAVGDLLDLGFGDNTTPPSTRAVAASAPAPVATAGFVADFGNFADFSCAPSMVVPQAAMTPTYQQAAQPAPMAGGGYGNSNATPAQTANLLDLQF